MLLLGELRYKLLPLSFLYKSPLLFLGCIFRVSYFYVNEYVGVYEVFGHYSSANSSIFSGGISFSSSFARRICSGFFIFSTFLLRSFSGITSTSSRVLGLSFLLLPLGLLLDIFQLLLA